MSYTWEGMIPIPKMLALYLYGFVPIYKLHDDNTESQVESLLEIFHRGACGVCEDDTKSVYSRTYNVSDKEVTFTLCTAMCPQIGIDEPVYAYYVHDEDDEFGNGDGVLFGSSLPETDAEAECLLYNEELITDSETLSTVKKEGILC